MSAASVAVPPQPYSAQKPADSVGVGRSPPNSPASRSKSLRPLFDQLATAGTHLDSMLEDMQFSKEETESLLASQRFRSHRQLRTELLSQQLQLAAQDHAQYALQRLLDLSNSPHSAIARLAATQILAYAGLTPPAPDQPSFLKTLAPPPEPPPPPSSPPPQSPPTPSARAAPASVPSQSSNPLRFPLTSILLTFLILLPVLLCGKTPNTQWTWLKVMPDQAFSNMAGRWDNYATSNAGETYFGAIDPATSTLHTSTYVGARRPILLKNLSLGKFQATFSFAGTSGIPGNEISFAFNAAGPEDYSYIEIPHQNWADPVAGWQVIQGQPADQVSSTGTAPPSTTDTDIIWSRITFDGTTLTMKRLVNNSSTPTESDWSSATVNFTSTAFAGGGGRLGFIPTGTGALDNLTIQSWNGSSWTTEAIDNFTVDSSGYAADTPTYDNNGNLTYDGTQSYVYDAWNRLIKISHAYRALTADGGDGNVHSGQPFETNTYDAAGRRIIKAILGTGPQDCTYHYYLSGNNIIEEQNGSAQTIEQNVWGIEYVDQLVQTSFNSDPADQSTCDTPYWVMQDANYNVLGVCDSSGILRERYEYSAYGQRQTFYSTGSNDPGCYAPTSLAQLCEFGFQGLMHDQPANLVYARARFLNTEFGRWNQEDPLGYVDSPDLYQTCLADPISAVDPMGTQAVAEPPVAPEAPGENGSAGGDNEGEGPPAPYPTQGAVPYGADGSSARPGLYQAQDAAFAQDYPNPSGVILDEPWVPVPTPPPGYEWGGPHDNLSTIGGKFIHYSTRKLVPKAALAPAPAPAPAPKKELLRTIDPPRAEDSEDGGGSCRFAMRIQVQENQGKASGLNETMSSLLESVGSPVTKVSVERKMTEMYLRISSGALNFPSKKASFPRNRYMGDLAGAIAHMSQWIRRVGPNGDPRVGNLHRENFPDREEEYRLDLESVANPGGPRGPYNLSNP